MSAALGVEKRSISMPATICEDVSARAGLRDPSAYVAGVVARQLERDALDDMLVRLDAEHGAVDEDEVAAIMARLVRG